LDKARDRNLVVKTAARQAGIAGAGLSIPRLPATRREAAALVKLVPRGQYKVALDFEASREAATSDELGQYRYVHFATHGFLNDHHPAELSGIVLSLFNERGRPQDGFLRAHEIFNLKLKADVVVLSACQTGLGKEVRGEGLIGLTRGFMYAGTPRVVTSLWDVDDAATAELMVRFYRGMLIEKLRPAKALQAAQVSMLKEKRYGLPYYWAAFTLQGEWR
jgi:CHAT domain-containing protein